MRSEEHWRQRLSSARRHIAFGKTLQEVRDEIGGLDKEFDWECFVAVMAQAFANPANMMLEWQIRNQSRYMMSSKIMKLADDEPDPDSKFRKMSQAIMIAAKLDENVLELQKALGLIKPIDIGDDGIGISSEDIINAQQRFNHLIEQKIENKLLSERTTQSADSVTVLSRLEPGGSSDQVGQPPLATDTAD